MARVTNVTQPVAQQPKTPVDRAHAHPPQRAPIPVATMQPPCDDERNVLALGPDLQFITLTTPAGANAFADLPLQIPKACKFIMLVSCTNGHMNDSLFMHFTPLNKQYTASSIAPTGQENWLPWCNGSGGTTAMTKIGLYYKFTKALPQTIFFDVGLEGGAGPSSMTFVVGNDIEIIGQLMNSTS